MVEPFHLQPTFKGIESYRTDSGSSCSRIRENFPPNLLTSFVLNLCGLNLATCPFRNQSDPALELKMGSAFLPNIRAIYRRGNT